MRRLVPSLALLAALVAPAAASDAIVKPGQAYAVIDTPRLHVLVPARQVERLKPFVARADVIYQRLARDAGYEIRSPLTLVLSDDEESHNGFSSVTPRPVIEIDLAPALQNSFIYTGAHELERTFVHEVAHHISNDRQRNGFRRTLETIFGRILPNDYLSLLVAYLSTPAHQTMPAFWHEGCAQWAETTYAPAGSAWGGRGRDSLTHMVWRLDADSPEGIPPPSRWRISYQQWPFGSETYLYGIAYLRWLDAAYGERASVWQLIERQQWRWAFAFDGGPEPLLDKSHGQLIAEARDALEREQRAQLAVLRSVPLTVTKRLTPEDARVGSPAWTRDGRLFASFDDPYDRPCFATVTIRGDGTGSVSRTSRPAWSQGEARSATDGTLAYSETPSDTNPWRRSRALLVPPDGWTYELPQKRLLQVDAQPIPDDMVHSLGSGARYRVAALHLQPAARQEILFGDVRLHRFLFMTDAHVEWKTWPVEGIPWSPAWRPGHDELSWVETDEAGSRLVLAPLADPSQRTVLARVRGRIIHPAWTSDGARVFLCADHSGVANAYAIDAERPGTLIPVTNTIGGIVSCVPSPDGARLAVIEHDRRGPYLATIPNDPATWPERVPAIELPFPAPLARARSWARTEAAPAADAATRADDAAPGRTRFELPAEDGDASTLRSHRYHGALEIRPLFWSPTTLATTDGGFGVIGMAADPLFTHEVILSAGAGIVDGHLVGTAAYVYGGWPLDIAGVGWRSERLYDDLVVDAFGDRHDYGERITGAEGRVGYGLAGLRRRHEIYVAYGADDRRPTKRTRDEYDPLPIVSLPPFVGREQYLEVTAAYDDSTFFPTSYAPEDGDTLVGSYRHTGFGGDRTADRATARAVKVITVPWPRTLREQSHQIVGGGLLGWSRGDRFLQGEFAIGGGGSTLQTLPRGYLETVATGDYLVGYSAAYRFPVWRPFQGFSTTPFVLRQIVIEGFFDAAKASRDHLAGDGFWYRSAGGELRAQWEVWYALLSPGIGVAQQLDGDKDLTAYFTLAFGW